MSNWKRSLLLNGMPELSLEAFKHNGSGKITLEGGDPPPAPPTVQTSYTNMLQPELMPYGQDIARKAQTLATANYTPYQGQRLADFNPNQQQVFGETMGMQTPGQYGQATGMAGASGIGGLMAGQNFANQATDPNATAQYMSPYMQNVVDYQKSQALRDYQMADPMRAAQASKSGAFGGTRHALVQSEAQRGLNSQLQGITAQGAQNAFQNAQAQQQFGANLGLQGMQLAGQNAQTLGQLGTQQQASDLARLQAQAGVGATQQQGDQAQLTQNYQDFLKQQEYPYSQLAFYNSMIRGLSPTMPTTTSTYAPAPSGAAQLAGLGLGAYSVGKLSGAI
jgi:hypothetical protein